MVDGLVSAVREFDDLKMIQLAIPIEPGNSGGRQAQQVRGELRRVAARDQRGADQARGVADCMRAC